MLCQFDGTYVRKEKSKLFKRFLNRNSFNLNRLTYCYPINT